MLCVRVVAGEQEALVEHPRQMAVRHPKRLCYPAQRVAQEGRSRALPRRASDLFVIKDAENRDACRGLCLQKTFERGEHARQIIQLRACNKFFPRAQNCARLAHIEREVMPENLLRAAPGRLCRQL